MHDQATTISAKTVPFSLDAVAALLEQTGLLNRSQAADVIQHGRKKETALRKNLGAKDGDSPYVSPIEVVASFGFPSSNPRRKTLDEDEICEAYGRRAGIPFERIDPLKLDARSVCTIVSKPFARKNLLVPVRIEGDELRVAMVNPFDKSTIHWLEDITGYRILPVLGLRHEILKTINEIFAFEYSLIKAEKLKTQIPDLGNLEQLVDLARGQEIEASNHHVVNAVDLLFAYAYDQRASDIHIEPKRTHAVVRVRIDGKLHATHSIPKLVYPSIVSRIKILSRMDIAEKRKPQDGRIKTKFKDTEVELRVSSVPMAFGEKLVIRIFDPTLLMQDLSVLGIFPEQLQSAQEVPRASARDHSPHRTHGKRQDDDSLLGAEISVDAGREHHHDRGPDRNGVRTVQSDRRPASGGTHVRDGAPKRAASGPGHHHGRRDPRPRDRRVRDTGRPHRTPRSLHAPHEHGGRGHLAPARPRNRDVPSRLDADRRHRPAAAPQSVLLVRRTGGAGTGIQTAPRDRQTGDRLLGTSQGRGVRALPAYGLQRPNGDHGDPRGDRGDTDDDPATESTTRPSKPLRARAGPNLSC